MLIPPSPLLLPTRPGMEGSRLSFALHERTWTTGEMTQGRKKAPDEVCMGVGGGVVRWFGVGGESKTSRDPIPAQPSHFSRLTTRMHQPSSQGRRRRRRQTIHFQKRKGLFFLFLPPPSTLSPLQLSRRGGGGGDGRRRRRDRQKNLLLLLQEGNEGRKEIVY